MTRFAVAVLYVAALALCACSGGEAQVSADAGRSVLDAGQDAGGQPDSGADAGLPDTGPSDGGTLMDWRKPDFCAVDDARVEAILSGMSLERKAAQVLMASGIGKGGTPAADTTRDIAELQVGGIFLQPLSGVSVDPTETAGLIKAMQEQAVAASGVPLFVSLDQEGGHAAAVNLLSGGTDTPGSMALGQAREPRFTFDCFDIMGDELNALGFNMDFAPVLDILPNHLNGAMNTRGFCADQALVSVLGPAAVWGLQDHRVLGTIKHVPGLGFTGLDSHKDLAVVDMSAADFHATTFLSFQRAVEAGADAMMTGHIIYTGIDPDFAGSMSAVLLRDIIRKDLGFQGLIITDSIGMAGAKLGAGGEEPAVQALIAGNDMVLLVDETFAEAEKKVNLIAGAVRDGRLSESDLDTAVRRILSLKMKYCAFESPMPDPAALGERLGTQQSKRRALAAAEQSIVLFREEKGVLPLNADQKILFIGPGTYYQDPGAGWPNLVDRSMGEELQHFSRNVTRHETVLPPDPAKAVEYMALVGESDVVVIATINAHYSKEQVDFFTPLLSSGKPVVLLTLGVPYDAWDLPGAGTVLNVTGQRSVSMIAAAKVLFGESEAVGKPAVSMEVPQ